MRRRNPQQSHLSLIILCSPPKGWEHFGLLHLLLDLFSIINLPCDDFDSLVQQIFGNTKTLFTKRVPNCLILAKGQIQNSNATATAFMNWRSRCQDPSCPPHDKTATRAVSFDYWNLAPIGSWTLIKSKIWTQSAWGRVWLVWNHILIDWQKYINVWSSGLWPSDI